MSSFSLDHALSSAALQCRRSEFLTYILETKVPGLHFNDDDGERLPMGPRLVDGAREDHMIAGHLHNGEGRDLDNAAMKILEEQDGIFHSQCLEFLCNFLMKKLKDIETTCSVLLDMAEHVEVLPPGNEPLPWDVLNVTRWKASLCELVKEMKTVEEKCPSLMGTSGVYVLTTSPYSAFLRALAAEMADAPVQIIQLDN